MSRLRQFLLCDSYEHADFCDQLVLRRLETEFGVRANAWSEVYTDGERYGIYWGSPVSDLFGTPEVDTAVIVVDETEETPWTVVRPELETQVDTIRLAVCDSFEQAVEFAVAFESEVYVDYGNKEVYGVRVPEEHENLFQNVIDAEVLVRKNGQFVSGNWEEVEM